MLFKREKTSCGIDLTLPSVPWVILQQQSKKLLVKTVGEGLQTMNAKKIHTAVANHQIMAKEITLPVAMSDEEIADYIKLVSSEVFMLPTETLDFDFYSLSKNRIKVYATRKNDIAKQQTVLQHYQIKVDSIEPEQHALLRAYGFYGLTNVLGLFIHCCDDKLQVYVVAHNRVMFYREFICEHNKGKTAVATQFQEVWHHYHGEMPEQVFISGDYKQSIIISAQNFFNTNIQLFNPFKKISTTLNDGKFALAIGLALRGCDDNH